MKSVYLFFVFAILLSYQVQGWKLFWKGRRKGGNLGLPSKISSRRSNDVKINWFIQNLDHFNPTNEATWQQKYFVNEEFYKPGGPVFLMIGGEGAANATWMNKGAWIKYAKNLNALCFQLEHRYYGKSHPTEDLSTENLVYLSSQQALADLAFFINSINKKYNFTETTKWIAFGGSYPGSLAAWLREKYPHLVHGSISSSGPLLAEIDFIEYYDVVVSSLASYSDECVDAVSKSFDQVEILLKHKIGQQNLIDKFRLCTRGEVSINNTLDISNFFENIASNFAGVVQYNKDNSPHAKITIDQICDVMINTTIGPQVDRLAEVNSIILHSNEEPCLDYKYGDMIYKMQNVSWESEVADGARQWTYQTCTEFGFYQTSNKSDSVFGSRFPVEFFLQQCEDIFGRNFSRDLLNKGVCRTNTNYGGLHPETTNVIYVHGSIDPWHALGLIKSNNPTMPTIYIKGTAHCANMYEPSKEDPSQLVQARETILTFINNILS